MSKSVMHIENLSMKFSSEKNKCLTVLENINLDIEENQFVCLIGPSGCGKSTLLRIFAGLQQATNGCVFFNNEKHVKPNSKIGMVFQNYSLMPWLNVENNIKLGLDFKNVPKNDKIDIVNKYLKIIGMEKFRKAMPHELSGGMQQRVAIARTLAANPSVVLMDEPFGALDAYTRILLQKELLNIWENDKKTIIFVTHSVDEAVYLADRIILMSKDKGKIIKDINVKMSRPRERNNPLYGQLTDELLDDLEKINKDWRND